MNEKIRIICGSLLLLFCNVLLGFILGAAIKTSGNPILIVILSCLTIAFLIYDVILIKWFFNKLKK